MAVDELGVLELDALVRPATAFRLERVIDPAVERADDAVGIAMEPPEDRTLRESDQRPLPEAESERCRFTRARTTDRRGVLIDPAARARFTESPAVVASADPVGPDVEASTRNFDPAAHVADLRVILARIDHAPVD